MRHSCQQEGAAAGAAGVAAVVDAQLHPHSLTPQQSRRCSMSRLQPPAQERTQRLLQQEILRQLNMLAWPAQGSPPHRKQLRRLAWT